jgi:hypothetical protein
LSVLRAHQARHACGMAAKEEGRAARMASPLRLNSRPRHRGGDRTTSLYDKAKNPKKLMLK